MRRRAKEEKFTVLFRHHRGHTCGEQYTVVSCVFWDAIEPEKASYLYQRLTDVLPKYGLPTSRQCEYNNRYVPTSSLSTATRLYEFVYTVFLTFIYNGRVFIRTADVVMTG